MHIYRPLTEYKRPSPLKRQVEVVLSVVKGNLTEMRIWDHFLVLVARSRRLYLYDYIVDWNF